MYVKEYKLKELQELGWWSDMWRMQKMRLDETGGGWNIRNSFGSNIQLEGLLLVEDYCIKIEQYEKP